jgi:serine/threonine protein phosphatase PrpC
VVCSVPFNRHAELDPPASTIVTAVVLPNPKGGVRVVTGWLGDSRLYWLSHSGIGKQLTRDHSWCNEQVDTGRMTEAQARQDKLAHAITKCIGTADFNHATPCPDPSVEVYDLPAEGWLLACSDGLWNYAETPSSLIIAANGRLWTSPAEDVCKQFVQFALDRGGMDNITCILCRLD